MSGARSPAFALACALAAIAAGCSAPEVSTPPFLVPRGDAGTAPDAQAVFDASVGPLDDVLREDFDHLGFVESSSVAIVDVNHGVATLPAKSFPPLTGEGVRTLSTTLNYNGLVDAESIVLIGDVTIDASDSLELHARDTVHITGRVRAGVGGVRVVAGRAIYVDGVIESAGPVRLQLADGSGDVAVTGRIETLAAESRSSGDISVESRGTVHLAGTLRTGDARYGDSGDISVIAYGDVMVDGADTRLAAGTSVAGAGGAVHITTESRVTVARAALSGGDGEVASGARTVPAGQIELRGAEIVVVDAANLSGGRSSAGAGGDVHALAAGALIAGRGVQFQGGTGRSGGTIAIDARTASVAATLRGGPGDEEAGRVLVTGSAGISLEPSALLAGGDGACAAGGDVVLVAAGPLSVAAQQVELVGGAGGVAVGSKCFGEFGGGNVSAVAHVLHGSIDGVARGGAGTPPGAVSVRLDAAFSRSAPRTGTRLDGEVVSRPFVRGVSEVGRAPLLLSLRLEVPEGTSARVELSDADASQPLWYRVVVDDPLAAARLSSARRLRYRVLLSGRALDAPVVDGFEVGTAP